MPEQLNPAFIKKKIEKSLHLERFQAPHEIEWLETSCQADSDFWPSLCRIHENQYPIARKSEAFKQYDFFHDLITRNLTRENPAFIYYDTVNQWQEISFQKLGQRAEQISNYWQNSGVLPGDILCIIKPFGIEYLVSFLAGLRTGVILSFIMPEGRTFIKKQLESLQPDHIATENIYFPLLAEWKDKIINEDGISKKNMENRSHTYMTGETTALFFDPCSKDPFTPKEINSDLLYLSGIRDGVFGLGLGPGDIFAAPGFNEILTQPCFVLSALINGATSLHLSIKDIKKNLDLLTIYPLKILGITSQLRDLLITGSVRKIRIWESWFRDPAESSDMHVWDIFIKKLELEDIPGNCMAWNSALGGCLLFSRRRKGQALQNVLPLPGRKWQLAMIEDEQTPALGELGIFSVNMSLKIDGETYIPTPFILLETFLEKSFISLNLPARKGIYYPKTLITKIVQEIESCQDAIVVEISNIGSNMAPIFHLLVFTGIQNKISSDSIIKSIKDKIQFEMGKAFFPDDIKIFPFFPRRGKNNKIDEGWCCSQYLSGGLEKKLKDDLFFSLSSLRAHVFRP